MKDLSKFNIPKKNTENAKEAEKPQEQINTRKKKLVIISCNFQKVIFEILDLKKHIPLGP